MSKIAWTGDTINCISGCTKVSPGCANCYAREMTRRLKAMGNPKYAAGFDTVVCHEDVLRKFVAKPGKARRIFWNSMSDTFHPDVPFSFIDQMFAAMALTKDQTHQILTKRAWRMREYMNGNNMGEQIAWTASRVIKCGSHFGEQHPWPLPNVHLGVTVEDQERADERIPDLLGTPAAVRFVSLEPLLGPVDLGIDCLAQEHDYDDSPVGYVPCDGCGGFMPLHQSHCTRLDWLVIGCESGPKRRECKLEWVEDIVRQADDAGVPVFVKQLSIDGQVSHDPSEWPAWARRQERPE